MMSLFYFIFAMLNNGGKEFLILVVKNNFLCHLVYHLYITRNLEAS